MTTHLLERDGVLLARMPLLHADSFAVHCDFQPAEAFAPYRALFDEEAALTDQLAHDPDPALMTRAEALLGEILALGFTVRREDGGPAQAVLLGIEGSAATFRPLHPEEELL
ncbi:hypothetical protein QOL99_07455 [Deinococcus sp. MIMF12]|uniref:Uncharacterized protein n=1 Tax=Deinococcus rhizophilus TaxID=3049544 RepID=A0ABT7JFZ9_9DEIO|nr:hypothetical protein [Deinococcus rhizophilus]MDL2343986.1 hypothetical protein [Deinococcus rhizophilus]